LLHTRTRSIKAFIPARYSRQQNTVASNDYAKPSLKIAKQMWRDFSFLFLLRKFSLEKVIIPPLLCGRLDFFMKNQLISSGNIIATLHFWKKSIK